MSIRIVNAVGGTRTRTGLPPGDFKSPALLAISTQKQAQPTIPSKTLAHESENDTDLAALLALWPRLPDGGRELFRTTAETFAGTLATKKGKRRIPN
jgi:hypothetical protein